MKKKKNAKTCRILILIISIFLLTGCTTTLVDSKKQAVKNPETGQSLQKIFCVSLKIQKLLKFMKKIKLM